MSPSPTTVTKSRYHLCEIVTSGESSLNTAGFATFNVAPTSGVPSTVGGETSASFTRTVNGSETDSTSTSSAK